jgi:hypothetical protein
MRLARSVGKPCVLVNRKGDIGSSIVGQVHEHADGNGVFEGFICIDPAGTIFVGSPSGCGSAYLVGVTVGETSFWVSPFWVRVKVPSVES